MVHVEQENAYLLYMISVISGSVQKGDTESWGEMENAMVQDSKALLSKSNQ